MLSLTTDALSPATVQWEYDETKGQLRLDKSFKYQRLSKRELEVLQGVLLGYTAKKIAQDLQISFRTIEAYIETLKWKLSCATKAEIITVAMQSGLYRFFFK